MVRVKNEQTDFSTMVPFTPSSASTSIVTTYSDRSGVPVKEKPVPDHVPVAASPRLPPLYTTALLAGSPVANTVPFGNVTVNATLTSEGMSPRNGKAVFVAEKKIMTTEVSREGDRA